MKRIFVHGEVQEVEASDPKLAQPVSNAAAELDAWRATTSVERHHFAKACASAAQFSWATEGVITWADAEAWGPGNALPVAVSAALASAITDPDQLAAARVDALSSTTIRRMHPIVEIIRAALLITPEQADDLFRLALELKQTT